MLKNLMKKKLREVSKKHFGLGIFLVLSSGGDSEAGFGVAIFLI
ncbi:hypothetical protein E2C01_023319 [Portunus trituberculatus]|uniref:Uncharacterized protein n=1 Tax=Portunus trituberculatus TaxID=210409 RepID=A0A5B7E9Q1_PORTR|nr:hypothetical protein [Portunus trituberculatus]